jgi:hypothetical protein
MSYFNEHSLEKAIMKLFEQQGYSYVKNCSIRNSWSLYKIINRLYIGMREIMVST